MSSDKFVICPQCGAITEKKDTFCGTCGTNLKEQGKESLESTYSQTSLPLQNNDHLSGSSQYGSQYAQPQTYIEDQAESKLKMAWIFAWITVCMGGTLFLILTVYFAIEAKKFGSEDPKIKLAIIIAVAGVIIQTIVSILLYIFVYIPFFVGTGL